MCCYTLTSIHKLLLCFLYSAAVERGVLCQECWTWGCFAGGQREGRITYSHNSPTACSPISEPQKVIKPTSILTHFTGHFPPYLHLTSVVLLTVQYTTCAGQRISYAVVCCGIGLHSGLPEDDWWVGDTGPTCRPLPRCGTAAAQEETTPALSIR